MTLNATSMFALDSETDLESSSEDSLTEVDASQERSPAAVSASDSEVAAGLGTPPPMHERQLSGLVDMSMSGMEMDMIQEEMLVQMATLQKQHTDDIPKSRASYSHSHSHARSLSPQKLAVSFSESRCLMRSAPSSPRQRPRAATATVAASWGRTHSRRLQFVGAADGSPTHSTSSDSLSSDDDFGAIQLRKPQTVVFTSTPAIEFPAILSGSVSEPRRSQTRQRSKTLTMLPMGGFGSVLDSLSRADMYSPVQRTVGARCRVDSSPGGYPLTSASTIMGLMDSAVSESSVTHSALFMEPLMAATASDSTSPLKTVEILPDVFTTITVDPYDNVIDNIATIESTEKNADRKRLWGALRDMVEREKRGEMTDAFVLVQRLRASIAASSGPLDEESKTEAVSAAASSRRAHGGGDVDSEQLLAAIHSMTADSHRELQRISGELRLQRERYDRLKQRLRKERLLREDSEASRKVLSERLWKHEPALAELKADASAEDMSQAADSAPIAYSREELASVHYALRSRQPRTESSMSLLSEDGCDDFARRRRSNSWWQWLGSGSCTCGSKDAY